MAHLALGNDPVFLLRQVFDAIEFGWLTDLRRLLDRVCASKEERCEFLSVRIEGVTALIRASRCGKLSIVRYLVLECNLDIEEEGKIREDTEVIDCVSPLWAASIGGHIDVVRFLVDNGADVNHATATNSTPLRAACFVGDEEVFDYLIDHGADVNKSKHDGSTCLMVACFHGHHTLVDKLLQHNAEKHPKCKEGWTMLYCASASGNLTLMTELIAEGEDVNSSFPNGVTSLMRACEDGKVEVVDLLLSHQVNVEKSTDQGHTALHFCAQHGHPECLLRLIEHGANIDAVSKNGETPLKKGCLNGSEEVVKIMLNHKARHDITDNNGNTAVHLCFNNRRLGSLKLLLEKGADVNAKNVDGETCLMKACYNAEMEVVKYLVSQGADINIVNSKGETALMKAFSSSTSCDAVIIALLLKGNSDPSTICGGDLYDKELSKSSTQAISLLTVFNIDINVKDNGGQTVLHKCVSSKHRALRDLRFLLMNGADVNIEDIDGKTPIMCAWGHLNREAVALLLKNGAKFDVYSACEDTLNTIFHECARKSDLSSLKSLIPFANKGLHILNKDGDTPLRLAALHGSESLVEYFVSLDRSHFDDKLDSLELLGAVLLGKPNEDAWSVNRSIRIWRKVALMRAARMTSESTSKVEKDTASKDPNVEIYPLICDDLPSLEDLDDFELNPVQVVSYAIKVCVKVLKRNHSRLPALLGEISDSFVRLDSISHGLRVWSYVLDLYQERLEPGHEDTLNTFRCFAEAFRYVISKGSPLDTDILFSVMRRALNELQACRVDKLANCILHFLATFTHLEYSEMENRTFLGMVREFVTMNYRTSKGGYSPLHLASSIIPEEICAREHHFKFPNLRVIQLLLQQGADIDAVDDEKNSILHIAVKRGYSNPIVLEFLLKEGAHLDAVNKDEKTVLELVRSYKVRRILTSHQGYVYPLQCLAARAIVKNNVDYERYFTKSLISFIKLH